MGFFAILILGTIIIGGVLTEKDSDNQVLKKETGIVIEKTVQKKQIIQEIKPTVEIKPEPIKEEIKSEPVKEEIKPEPVKEEIKPEPVKEEIKPEPVKEKLENLSSSENSTTSYFRLILYIIGGIFVTLSSLYFFSNRRSKQPSASIVDNKESYIKPNIDQETQEEQPVEEESQPETQEEQPVEEESQPETQEEQPVEEESQPETQEEQPVEEESQPETQEVQPVKEDDNTNK
jgi:outer membrane biosynthesis protein TonB